MSLGQNSIAKRVAKPATEQAAPSAPAKKAPVKKSPAKKPTATVIAKIAPETVEKVVAHKQNDPVTIISLGDALPPHLL